MHTIRSSPLRANDGYHRWPLGTLQMLRFYDWWGFRTTFNDTEIHAFRWKETKCYRCTKLSMFLPLIARTCEYVTLHEKSDFEIRIQLRPWDEEIILDYPGWPSPIAWGIKESWLWVEGNVTTEERIWETAVWGLSPHHCKTLKMEEGIKKYQWSLEAGRGKKMGSPLMPSRRNPALMLAQWDSC